MAPKNSNGVSGILSDSIPVYAPSARTLAPGTPWSVSTHYFASYAKRRVEPTPSPRTATEPIVRKNDDLGNLTVVVNRYLPLPKEKGVSDAEERRKSGVTLVLAHCIAGHKEVCAICIILFLD